MKFLKNAMFAMLASVLFIACSKDKDSTPAPQTLEGRFVGQYKFTNSAPTYYYSLNFKAGGILEEINSSNQKIGEGTWQLNGSTMTASYHYTFGNQTAFSLSATFDGSLNKLTGTWGFDNSATDGGTFEMVK